MIIKACDMLYRVGRPDPLLLLLVLVHILSLVAGRRQWLHLGPRASARALLDSSSLGVAEVIESTL